MHFTTLASGHLHDLNASTHKVTQEVDENSHVICYWIFVFVPASIAHIILDLGVDGIDTSITKVAFRFFGSLLHSSSR